MALAAVAINVALNKAMMATIEALGRLAAASVRAATDLPTPTAQIGDTLETIGLVTAAFGSLLGIMGLPIIALGELAKVTGATMKAFATLMAELDQAAKRYGEVNPQIAVAEAQADIAMLIGDFRRAQMVAPQFERYIEARTEVQQRVEDIKVRFMQRLLPLATDILEKVAQGIDSAEDFFVQLGEMGKDIPLFGPLLEEIARIARELRNEQDQIDSLPTDLILNQQKPDVWAIFDQPDPMQRR